jgi:hypothetical protein
LLGSYVELSSFHNDGYGRAVTRLAASDPISRWALRITCSDAVIETVFRPFMSNSAWSMLSPTLWRGSSTAGVRVGEDLERDMVATRIGPDWRFSVVGSPAYFERRSPPEKPYDLSNHNCINLRLSTGGFLRWEFRSPEGKDLDLRVETSSVQYRDLGAWCRD